MTDVKLEILSAGPLTTLQDQGRKGYQHFGVTESGPVDSTAFRIGQYLLENNSHGSAIEIGSGGIDIVCLEGSIDFAFTGGDFNLIVNGIKHRGWIVGNLEAGDRLTVRKFLSGNWSYLAFAGLIETQEWLGSKSVNPAWEQSGRPFTSGDVLTFKTKKSLWNGITNIPTPQFSRTKQEFNVVLGPQERFFTDQAIDNLLSQIFLITPQYNRMGVQIEGAELAIKSDLSMPSEGIARGSIQVQGSGKAVVLSSDHQTTGGYPKIATVISTDLDRFLQLTPRSKFIFKRINTEEAFARSTQKHQAEINYLKHAKREIERLIKK